MRQTTNASLPSSQVPPDRTFHSKDCRLDLRRSRRRRSEPTLGCLTRFFCNMMNLVSHPRIRHSTLRLSSCDMSMWSLTTRLATLSTSSSSAWFSGRLSSDAESVTRGIAVVMSSPSTGGLGRSAPCQLRTEAEATNLHFDYEPPLALQAHRQSNQPAAVFVLPADRPEVHPPDALEPEAGG